MLFQEYSAASEEFAPLTVCLNRIWHVKAEPDYIVNRNKPMPGFLLIRTLAGHGRVETDEAGFDLKTNDILFVRMGAVRHYRCAGNDWHFYWFEFEAATMDLPLDYVFNVKPVTSEIRLLEDIFSSLRRENQLDRDYASAAFQFLLYNWQRDAVTESESNSLQDRIVIRIIDRMHHKLKDNWQIVDMARFAGMGERNFRMVFRKVTGRSPKQYYDSLRLDYARAMLSQGLCSVQEVAETMNFSTPFYFSRAFTRQFGINPSTVIPRPT